MSAGPARTVIVAATLDTKSVEVAFVRRAFEQRGVGVTVIDCGVLGEASIAPEISRSEIARAGGGGIDELRAARDRANACLLYTSPSPRD